MTAQSPAAAIAQLRELLQTGDLEKAAGLSRQAQQQLPDEPEAFRLGARAALRLADYPGAITQASRAVELRPRNVAFRLLLAEALFLSGDVAESFEQVRLVEESAGQRAGALRQAARFHRRFGQPAKAYVLLLRALAAEPDSAQAVSDAGSLAWQLGKHDEARALARRLWRLEPSRDEAVLLRSLSNPASSNSHHIEALNFLLKTREAEMSAESGPSPAVCQAIGRELEDLGQYEPAFVSYLEAASRRGTRQTTSQWINHEGVTAVEERFAALEGKVSQASPEHTPLLFVIGLDCSVTRDFSLWLGQRSGLHDLGAANPVQGFINRLHPVADSPWVSADVQSLSQGVRDWLKAYPGEGQWLMDTSRGHYLRLGLLQSAFPAARFIHFRRNPLDQCLDLLCPEPGSKMTDPVSLEDLADHYTAYHRLMGHWRRRFSGSLLEMDAERWISEPREADQQLSEYLGLKPRAQYDIPGTLRPDERAGRSGRFNRLLAPLARRLEANGVPLPDSTG